MPHTGYDARGEDIPPERYAVVSCHVERPLDDAVWEAFRRFQARRPGGFRITALVRPPDARAGEAAGDRVDRWLKRAQVAAEHGPFGLHTHFGGREQGRARPGDPEPADRVRAELAYLAERGLAPRFFCGGNWYLDERVAGVLAAAGLADCTATAFTPRHLPAGAPRLSLAAPAWLRVEAPAGLAAASGPGGGAGPGGAPARLLELPTTHSLGMTVRAALDPAAPPTLHCYFHDTDLLDRRRSLALAAGLALLGRRRRPLDLDELATLVAPNAPERSFGA